MKKQVIFFLSLFIISIAMSAQTDSTDVAMDASTDAIDIIDFAIAIDDQMDSCADSIAPSLNRGDGDGGIVYYPEPSSQRKFKKGKPYEVHGVVSDDTSVLDGVIFYLSSGEAIITNEKGEFTVKTSNETEILRVSYLGYQSLRVIIGPEYRDKTIHVALKAIPNIDVKPITIAKPVIYLYPQTKTEVSIINHFKGELLTTYPTYNNGWKVIAEPNGRLLNLADNRNYNSLFWDGYYTFPASHFHYKEGFYIKRGNYTHFLQEKLALIGLNETEINDFIVYWLPILNKNQESFIHFGVNDDLGNSSVLEVAPKPDTMIRLYMEFKKYNGEAKLPEQKLASIKREKFTLVEWGGAEIGSNNIR